MRAVLLGLLSLFVSACAGARAVSTAPLAPEPLFALAPPPPPLVIRPAAVHAVSLRAAFAGFRRTAAQARALHRPGTPMPEGEASNWRGLLSQVAGYLARPRQGTPLREVDLASKQLEAELRRDANVYGAFSVRLADAVAEQQGALAVRAEEIRRAQKRAAERNPTFQWPLERIRITSLFGRRLHPLLGKVRRHDGVDLAAGRGSPIHASASGTVLRAGRDGGYGILVELLHKDGSRTRYAHLMRALVRVGDVVDGGDVLGQVGSTGLSTGPHLHFELWRKGRARNPLRILGAPRSAKAGAERGSSPSVPVRRTTASS